MTASSVTIADADAGSHATVLVSQGFNCYEFRAGHDVLWSTPNFCLGNQRPSGSGIPILFPFPGRIRQGVLRWQGREYHLPAQDGRGNAIHGFVYDRPWRVIDQSARHVIGQFQAAIDDPSLLDLWPADFRITATYEVVGPTLWCRYRLENPDSRPLPCGFGTHPYFTVPTGAEAESCEVRLPATGRWELRELLPTGNLLEGPAEAALARGMRLSDTAFDDVFTGLGFEGEWCTATIGNSTRGPTTRLRFDRAFRECVVYNPPHRQAVCIEPYTCVPGAWDLQETQGLDAGWRILPPGGSMEGTVVIEGIARTRDSEA